MSEWQPGLGTSKAMEDFLDILIHHAAQLFGICEIIPGCAVTNVDPAAVGVGVIPRYVAVRIHEYVEHVLWRGRPAEINVADEVTVMRMAEGNRHEVLGAGGATGADSGVVAPTARGDVLAANATPAWVILAIGTAHQIFKVNAGGTDPVWASFDWDEISVAAAADMRHSHESDVEGSRINMIGPSATIRIEMDANGAATIRLGDDGGLRNLEVQDDAGVVLLKVFSDGALEFTGYVDLYGPTTVHDNLTVNDFLYYNVEHKTVPVAWSPYTAGMENVIYANAVGGAITITMDVAANLDGKYYTIKKIDASANVVTINPPGGETIDGALTLAISIPDNSVKIHCDGSNWFVVNRNGLPFGSCYGNHIGWTQVAAAQNTWYNISDADIADGELNNVTHDGSGELTVLEPGRYLITYSLCYENDVANDHIEVGIEVSNSGAAEAAGRTHSENKFANEEEHLGGTAILHLTANDTIELAIRTTDNANPDIEVQGINLAATMIGGGV